MEFYQRNSLKDCFKALDTALLVPFKEPESRAGPWPPGRTWGVGWGGGGGSEMEVVASWWWDGRGGFFPVPTSSGRWGGMAKEGQVIGSWWGAMGEVTGAR